MADPLGSAPAVRADNQTPELFGQTPAQTVGPFFHYGLPWKGGADLVGTSDMGARPELFPPAHYVLNIASPIGRPAGEAIEIVGCVSDGEGNPVPDALIEIWQANAAGCYHGAPDLCRGEGLDPHFIGFGRASTSEEGEYRFRTIMPGRVPGPGEPLQAPHIAVSIFGRGLTRRLVTRIYFAGAPGNGQDAILALVPTDRLSTLIAEQVADGLWRFDIRLQGSRETVFFDL